MNIMHVDTVDFSVCSLIQGDNECGRRVFIDKTNNKYYKVWDENYNLWGNNIGSLFLQAVFAGFFDGIADIESVIFSSSGNCIGYTGPSLKSIDKKSISIVLNKYNFEVLDTKDKQNIEYQKFFNRLCLNISKTKLLYYDLVTSNIGIDDSGKYKLIDLNSVININRFHTIPQYHQLCIPEDYRKFILGFDNKEIDMELVEKAWSMSTGGLNKKPYCSVVINGRIYDGERPWEDRWSLIKYSLDWEGLKVLDMGTCMGLVPAYLSKYCGIKYGVGTDFNSYHLEAANIIKKAFKIPDTICFELINMDKDDYEDILSYNYDVVFCLSFIRWINDKERLFRYLSHFKTLVIEPHDLDGDVVSIFKSRGFNKIKHLGSTKIGKNFSQERDLYLFQKDD